jgi:glycosyltransferase involved in cell wall biosynthesis
LDQYPSARFLVVGDGPLRSELEAQARLRAMIPAIIFTGLRTDIPALLSALDVFVLSSRWEGLPNAVLEAMAAERPVVATAVDGVRGVVTSEKNGLLVPSGDSSALAVACLRLASDSDMRNRLGRAGYEYVAEHHGLTAMLDKYTDCYAELLHEHGFTLPNKNQSLRKLEAS